MKTFITDRKIEQWTLDKKAVDERWIDCFQFLSNNEVPYETISTIVAYALCLPGTSAVVERVFSTINKLWTVEKTRLQITTLKSILFVKHNFDFDCINFYDYLKSKPEIMRKIGQQNKYINPKPSTSSQAEMENN